jgi:membrane protein DedA with SNARE-associated domain
MEHLVLAVHTMETWLSLYGGLAVLVGTFLLGENAALASFALSAQGYIHPVKAVLFVFIGSMLADIFWFFVTEYIFRKKYEKYPDVKPKNDTEKMLMNLVDHHFFWILIFIKFLIGMRLFLTVYIVLKNKIPFFRKVILDAVGTVIFLLVIFPAGWFFGKGVSSIISLSGGFMGVVSILVFVVLFAVISPHLIVFILKKFFKGGVIKEN